MRSRLEGDAYFCWRKDLGGGTRVGITFLQTFGHVKELRDIIITTDGYGIW
jgi:hypothetical protein